MAGTVLIIRRKARKTKTEKQLIAVKKFLLNNTITFLKYGTIPCLWLFSMRYTEPQPTLFELANPFW